MTPDRTIDLRAQLCPMTFVRTRLALDALAPGQRLLVLLAPGESQERVPHTVAEQGHAILSRPLAEDGTMLLLIERG